MSLVECAKLIFVRLLKRTWELNISCSIPSDRQHFLNDKIFSFKWLFKFLKRYIFFKIFVFIDGSSSVERIPETAQSILWINLSAPSLGDCIMDLSSRIYLKDRRVDLLTSQKSVRLFYEDEYFERVSDSSYDVLGWSVSNYRYDLVIVDSYSPRVLAIKRKVAPNVPFATMYGFVNGFEVHRIYFSFARMEYLLGLTKCLQMPRVNTLSVAFKSTEMGKNLNNVPSVYICLVVGGEWEFRTYPHWADILNDFDRALLPKVVLVGSQNGARTASELKNAFPSVVNLVGSTSLEEVAHVLAGARGVVCCDGGLWHIASAFGVPSVCLFAACDLFDKLGKRVTRETADMNCYPIYATNSVSQIDPKMITEKFPVIYGWLLGKT